MSSDPPPRDGLPPLPSASVPRGASRHDGVGTALLTLGVLGVVGGLGLALLPFALFLVGGGGNTDRWVEEFTPWWVVAALVAAAGVVLLVLLAVRRMRRPRPRP